VFLLHLLVMTSTLLSLSRVDKLLHGLEDLIHPPHVFINEMLRIELEEPMVSFVLFEVPVTSLPTLG